MSVRRDAEGSGPLGVVISSVCWRTNVSCTGDVKPWTLLINGLTTLSL